MTPWFPRAGVIGWNRPQGGPTEQLHVPNLSAVCAPCSGIGFPNLVLDPRTMFALNHGNFVLQDSDAGTITTVAPFFTPIAIAGTVGGCFGMVPWRVPPSGDPLRYTTAHVPGIIRSTNDNLVPNGSDVATEGPCGKGMVLTDDPESPLAGMDTVAVETLGGTRTGLGLSRCDDDPGRTTVDKRNNTPGTPPLLGRTRVCGSKRRWSDDSSESDVDLSLVFPTPGPSRSPSECSSSCVAASGCPPGSMQSVVGDDSASRCPGGVPSISLSSRLSRPCVAPSSHFCLGGPRVAPSQINSLEGEFSCVHTANGAPIRVD